MRIREGLICNNFYDTWSSVWSEVLDLHKNRHFNNAILDKLRATKNLIVSSCRFSYIAFVNMQNRQYIVNLFPSECGEMVFMDSTGGLDNDQSKLFLLVTSTNSETIPLGKHTWSISQSLCFLGLITIWNRVVCSRRIMVFHWCRVSRSVAITCTSH